MKVADLTKRMNDFGTNPHVCVLEYKIDYNLLVFEGKPDCMNEEIANLTVNSFTVLGKGFLEIYAENKG